MEENIRIRAIIRAIISDVLFVSDISFVSFVSFVSNVSRVGKVKLLKRGETFET